jgi:hypothetical protein
LHATGVGLVLLANAPAEVQEAVLAAPLHAYTKKTITDPVRLREALDAVRRNGYAVSDGQVTLDALSVAAPVMGRDGVVAAVSLVVRAETAQPKALAPLVMAAGRGIARALSGPPVSGLTSTEDSARGTSPEASARRREDPTHLPIPLLPRPANAERSEAINLRPRRH